jgi:hypothetical protein
LPASIDLVARIRRVLFEVNVQLIDFNRAKARKRDVQIFFDQQFGKVRQLDRTGSRATGSSAIHLPTNQRQTGTANAWFASFDYDADRCRHAGLE